MKVQREQWWLQILPACLGQGVGKPMVQQPPEGTLTPPPPTVLPTPFPSAPNTALQFMGPFQVLGEQEHHLWKSQSHSWIKLSSSGSSPFPTPRETPEQEGTARSPTIQDTSPGVFCLQGEQRVRLCDQAGSVIASDPSE